MTDLFGHIYRKFVVFGENSNDLLKINYQPKHDGDNKGQFGYYPNSNVADILLFMKEYDLKTIMDLGAGAGILVHTLRRLGFKAYGMEIEDSLVEISNNIQGMNWDENSFVIKQDILTIASFDIQKYDCIYFWEPFYQRDLAKKFVENLSKSMKSGQYILYKRHGDIFNFLDIDVTFKKLPMYGVNDCYYVFQKI
jgi:2-polyprenyl-3-methyl-5-hydroxy-6-metoxy-1,4-benzoquinol methylase